MFDKSVKYVPPIICQSSEMLITPDIVSSPSHRNVLLVNLFDKTQSNHRLTQTADLFSVEYECVQVSVVYPHWFLQNSLF